MAKQDSGNVSKEEKDADSLASTQTARLTPVSKRATDRAADEAGGASYTSEERNWLVKTVRENPKARPAPKADIHKGTESVDEPSQSSTEEAQNNSVTKEQMATIPMPSRKRKTMSDRRVKRNGGATATHKR